MERVVANTGGSGGSRLHRDHQVEFYETAEYLADSVCGFVEPALRDGDAAIVVATEAHRHDFAAELTARGIDVQTAADSGRFLALDAAETLALFMADGRPDPARFTQALVPLIERAATGGRAVRIYGEMVALLWEDGNVEAAIGLEDLWNDLAGSHPFSLLCAYPMAVFAAEASTAPFRRMCQQHTGVTPTERYSALSDPEDRAYAFAVLQQEAAAAVAESAALRAQQVHLVEASRQLAAARDQALAATGAISGELRTPIDAVVSLTGLLLDNPLSGDQRPVAQELRSVGEALLGIVDDVVDFSALESGTLQLDVGELDVGRLVEDVGRLVVGPARARGLTLETEVDPALPSARRGDAPRLRRVLLNVVSKALALTGDGEVVIRARPVAGGQVRFEVVDTGSALGPEEAERPYDGFAQADAPMTLPHRGAGFALSVSRRLVEAMGGRTGVDSAPGRGSTVWFTVPLPVDWFAVPVPASPGG